MTASELVPGIYQYPEIALQLEQQLSNLVGSGKCNSCATNGLARRYRAKMEMQAEREKLSKGKKI